jgi:hypothetical protein
VSQRIPEARREYPSGIKLRPCVRSQCRRKRTHWQNCGAEQTLYEVPFTGAQQPDTQSVPSVHLSAQVAFAADVPTHAAVSPLMLRQQSESPVQEVPGFAHVLLQNPRGAHAIMPVFL